MSLSDPSYIGFFAAVFVVFYLLPGGMARLVLLLVTSLAFYYKLSGLYISVLLSVAAIVYVGGLLVQRCTGAHTRQAIFLTALLTAVAPLIILKYLAFLCDSAGVEVPSLIAQLALPVGLSFFTFAALGYLIDVNLEIIRPEHNPLRLAVFVTFFPLITAGPIERGGRLLPQLDLALPFSSQRALAGLRLIFIGLVLKVLFADALAAPVATVFGAPESFLPLEKLIAVVIFPFNLYADFAGYSLIAIGCANMLGIDVQPNFRQPFLSPTIPEFWRTWHMSLSFWVRDYLFTPLRAHWRRTGQKGVIAATMLSFLIIGVWHGAGWPFVVLGLCFGTLAVGSLYTMKYRDAVYAALGVPPLMVRIIRAIITFFLVALVLVLFRASYFDDALQIYRDIFSLEMLNNVWTTIQFYLFHQGAGLEFHQAMPLDGTGTATNYWLDWGLIATIIAGDILVRNGITLARCPLPIQIVAYNVGLILIVYQWMSSSVAPPFLYYKF
jgi:D-alanyl-lipoteichoic acid acyltransferase DltB (MBOAT superfamily)